MYLFNGYFIVRTKTTVINVKLKYVNSNIWRFSIFELTYIFKTSFKDPSPKQLKTSIQEIRKAELSLGSKYKVVLNSELANKKKLKKSLVTSNNFKKGHKINLASIKIKRPGTGIRPKDLNKILGLKINQDLKKDNVLKKSIFFKK